MYPVTKKKYGLTKGGVVVVVFTFGILLVRTIGVGFRRELRGPSGEDVVSRTLLWWGDVPETLGFFVVVVVIVGFFNTLFLLLTTFTGIEEEDEEEVEENESLLKSVWNQSISVCALSGFKLPWYKLK